MTCGACACLRGQLQGALALVICFEMLVISSKFMVNLPNHFLTFQVGTDFLEEEITKFEDLVQSVDIAAFNKIQTTSEAAVILCWDFSFQFQANALANFETH